MPQPPFEITTPPDFEVIEEPSKISDGRTGLYAALIEHKRGRRGVLLARQTRPGTVRTMAIYADELGPLSDYLHSRRETGN